MLPKLYSHIGYILYYMDCSLISLFNSRRRITSFDDNGDDTESVLSSHSHSSRSTHSSNASFHGTYRTPGPSIGRSFDRNVYKFIHNNPQFQFMNAHVKDGVTNNNSSNTSYDVRNSGADSSILGMSTALEESIDYEQILFANCVLKSESLKGIARNTNNKRSNIRGGGGLYAFDDDREDEESSTKCVANVATNDENTHATDKVVILPPATGTFKEEEEEKEDYDESFASLLRRAKHILKLIRIAQQQERMQLLQQHQHVKGNHSSPLALVSPLPDNTVETATRESAPQSQSKLASETLEQREEEAEEKEEQQQQLEPSTNQHLPSPSTKSQLVEAVTATVPAPKSLQEDQRTAMDTFLSSPTGLNWSELVESMRQQPLAGESGKPRCSSSRRSDLVNIQTITIRKQLDELDDDDNCSLTLSSSSGSPNQSQLQKQLQDNQRTAMESFLSSPTGLNWDDLVKSLKKERGDDCRSRQAGYISRPSACGRVNIKSITIHNREEGDYDDMSSLGMQSRDEGNHHRHRKQRQQQKQQKFQDGSSTAKNGEETMKNATVDVKSSSLPKRGRQKQMQQYNQSSHTQDHSRRSKKDLDEARRSKDKRKRSLERRIGRVLALTPIATTTDKTYTSPANINILNDLMLIDEGIALTPKTIATVSTTTSNTTGQDVLSI